MSMSRGGGGSGMRGGGGGARGQYRQIGGDGEWAGTNAILGFGGRIYASHSNGKLFGIDPSSGQWQQVGNSNGWKTRLMFGLANMLCLVETSGTMYAVDPNTGGHQQVGKDGEWANIDCGDWTRENIYCHSTQGGLWQFSPQGGWRQLGTSNGWKTRQMFAGRGVVCIEQDGTMYRIDPMTGGHQQIGKNSTQVNCGVGMHGHVYAHFSDGGIYDYDIDGGSWSEVGNEKTWRPKALTTTGDDLITLEERGTFFELYL